MKKYSFKKLLVVGAVLIATVLTYANTEKVLQIFKDGEILHELRITDFDFLEVNDIITPPSEVTSQVGQNEITITWNKVDDASYSIYRSGDNIEFTLLASDIKETQYTDKNPLIGSNYYKVKAVVAGKESPFSSSAVATIVGSSLESGIYVGISSFNQALYNHPIAYLDAESYPGFHSFIDDLTTKYGTLLYYSVDQALNTLEHTQLPSDISTAAIVTFTDGLDQGSFMKDEIKNKYQNSDECLDGLNERIMKETVVGQSITAYSIGILGNDVSDVAQFRKNLTKLASAPENAIEVTSMAEVNQKFKEIAGQLTQSNFVQTISLKIPGQVNGTLIRFTFDNVSDAAKSQLYIEGTFNLDNFSLENVKYVGMTSKSGDIIKGNVDGIFVTFTFQGVRTDTNKLIDKQFADEWTYITSNGKWQINSEFDKKEDSEVVTERSSAVIMLVLDCSSSLASDFPKAQSNAKDFIDTLYKAVGGVTDPNNPEDPNNPDDPEESLTIYSTTPIDLSIAVFHTELKKRYYLTLDQYSSANLKDFYVEGLTVCSAMGNFIISPKELQFHSTSAWLAEELYDGYLPTKTQGSIIVARWSDINQALDKAGFSKLYDDITYICGERATDNEDEYIHYGFKKVSNSYNLTVTWGFVRGVRDVSQPSVMWSHPDNFKLAVMKDGAIEYIDDPNTDLSQFDSVLGISYIQIHEKEVQNLIFLGLENAQSGPLNYEMAEGLYGDVMPTYTESVLIQNFRIEFNSAISKFGGNQLDTTTNYWIRISDGDYAGVIYYLDWTDVWNVPGAVKWGSKSYNNYVRKMGRINSGETQSIPFKKEFSIKTKQL